MLVLHHAWRSSASRRVRLCLEEKGLVYEGHVEWTDEELAAHLKKIPSKERQVAWLRVARRPYTEEERATARAKLVVDLLERMESTLTATAWLAGSRYTIADIAVVPFVKRIDEEIAPEEADARRTFAIAGPELG